MEHDTQKPTYSPAFLKSQLRERQRLNVQIEKIDIRLTALQRDRDEAVGALESLKI